MAIIKQDRDQIDIAHNPNNVILTTKDDTTTILQATTSNAGVMTAADKVKLDGLGGGGVVQYVESDWAYDANTHVSESGSYGQPKVEKLLTIERQGYYEVTVSFNFNGSQQAKLYSYCSLVSSLSSVSGYTHFRYKFTEHEGGSYQSIHGIPTGSHTRYFANLKMIAKKTYPSTQPKTTKVRLYIARTSGVGSVRRVAVWDTKIFIRWIGPL